MTVHDNSGPGIAVTLRLIAAWLESHPDAIAYEINFIGSLVRVYHFGLNSEHEIAGLMARIGDTGWRVSDESDSMMFQAELEIAPGVMYTIAVRRARLETPEQRHHRELHDGTLGSLGPAA